MSGTCVVKRRNRYAVQVYLGLDPITKKRRYKWHSGFAGRREAEAFRATLASHPAFSAGLGLYGNTRLRVGDYLDTWLKDYANAKPLEEKTEEWYGQVIEKHLKPALGHIPLSRLSPQTIQELYNTLHAKGLSRTTVRHIANELHLTLAHAVKRGLIARNPVDQTDPPRRDTKPATTLSPEQLQTYLADAKETSPIYVWVLYWTMAGTGMRFGELLGLRDSDLDLEQGVLSVVQTLKGTGRMATFGKPKTERSRRAITLPLEVVDGLRRLRKWRKEQRLRVGPKYRDLGLVFCLADGRPLHQNNIRQRDHYPRLKRLGLPRIRLHDLRHTHGTQLIAAGVDARTVADRLGHSSPAFTMSVYVHGTNDAQRQAALVASKMLVKTAGLGGAQ